MSGVFTEPEVAQVAAAGVEEEAVVMVRVIRPGPVMAEVTTLLIRRTGLVTLSQTGN